MVIIGGGVVGLCSAYYLNLRGFDVTIVDQGSPDAVGCSFGNAGLIVPSHFVPLAAPGMVALGLRCMWSPESPFYLRPRFSPRLFRWGWRFWRACSPEQVRRASPVLRDLSLASRSAYEELVSHVGSDLAVVKNGLLLLCKTEHAFQEEGILAEQAKQLGIPAEVLDPGQTASKDPQITMAIVGAIYYPLDCHLSPMKLMDALRKHLTNSGVLFRWNTAIHRWVRRNSHIAAIESATESFEADEYVLAAGVWSDDLARQLNLRIPMEAGKGYSLTLPNPPELPSIPAILVEGRVAVTPMGTSLRFGGTMELSGIDRSINPSRIRGIVKSALQYYPTFRECDFEDVQPWCGLRPCSPDGLPYLGRIEALSNLTVATGHAMLGISLGPITGKIVSELTANQSPTLDIDMLSISRFK